LLQPQKDTLQKRNMRDRPRWHSTAKKAGNAAKNDFDG
jgi:hypothetical protein